MIESYPAVSPERARRIALVAGVLFLITYITSIPALSLFQPVLDDPAGYIAGAGSATALPGPLCPRLLLIIAQHVGTGPSCCTRILASEAEIPASPGVTARRRSAALMLSASLSEASGGASCRQDAANAADSGSTSHLGSSRSDWTFRSGPGLLSVSRKRDAASATRMYQSELPARRSRPCFGPINGGP
jgi:hypothetical protein